MSVEEAFAKAVGHQSSEKERARLYRVGDALGLHDNDAFWSIVMPLEHYDAFFRQSPAQLAEQTSRSIDGEAAQVQRVLSETVAEASEEIARKLAEKPVELHHVTTPPAAVVAFGGPCVASGYSLASADKPFAHADEGAP